MQAEQLLRAAIALHAGDTKPDKVPAQYASVEEAVSIMRLVLAFEGHTNLQEPLNAKPADPYLCCLDLGTEEPGIVRTTKPKIATLRLAPSVGDADALLTTAAEIPDEMVLGEPIEANYEEALASARKLSKKRARQCERTAARQEERDAKTMEKREAKERLAQERANETKEDKKLRLQAAREEREAKKQRKAEAAEEQGAAEPALSGNAADDGAHTRTNDSDGSAVAGDDEDAAVLAKGSDRDVSPDENNVASSESHDGDPNEEDAMDAGMSAKGVLMCEQAACPDVDSVLPPMLIINSKTKYFPNPTPYVRHISALCLSGLGRNLMDPILRNKPNDNVVIVQGPPGTGKSRAIVEFVRQHPDDRILVCAPSNVATAGIYSRLIDVPELRDQVALCLPSARIPAETVILSNDSTRRVICATVSGRNGPVLQRQAFDIVAVDEAAQCTEACCWTLLRPSVKTLMLVGDTRQLPAIVTDSDADACGHGRSLMERLVDGGYPATTLTTQYRMHDSICAFPSRAFYDGGLATAASCQDHTLVGVPSYQCRVVSGEPEEINGSFRNVQEAKSIVDCAREMRSRFDEKVSIVIIAGYQAQCRAILARNPNVPVHTVDSFQGREADIVLLSICRTGNKCGFFNDKRRLNVALTRAKRCMLVYGSFDWSDGPLAALAKDAKARKALVVA